MLRPKKRKRRQRLYCAYLEEVKKQVMEPAEPVKIKNELTVVKKGEMEKKKKKEKAVISITELKHGIGSTHISFLLADYLISICNKNCCIVQNKGTREQEKIDVYSLSELPDLMDQYDYIILDLGVIQTAEEEKEIKRADIKIMLCIYQEAYSKQLAQYLSECNYSTKNKYLYNFVSKDEERDIYDLMEDYQVFFMPVTNNIENKETKKVFHHLLC